MSQYYNSLSKNIYMLFRRWNCSKSSTSSREKIQDIMKNLDLTNDVLKEGLETAVSTSYNNGV